MVDVIADPGADKSAYALMATTKTIQHNVYGNVISSVMCFSMKRCPTFRTARSVG